MKFSCTRENLHNALQVIGHIAHKNVNLPILQNILVKASDGKIVLASTNLEIGIQTSIRGKVDEEGEFTLPAQLLSSYVQLLNSGDRVDCTLEDKMFAITAGDQHTVVKGEEASEFPILPSLEEHVSYSIPTNTLEVGLQRVALAASVDETRPEIAGVQFVFSGSEVVLAATDSYRLAEARLPIVSQESEEKKVILPQRSAVELLRILQVSDSEQLQIHVSPTQFGCTIGDIEFVSPVIEGNFPDYSQIIPTQSTTSATVVVDDFIKAIKGAALFSKTGINDVRITFDDNDGQLRVNAINAQLGENTATVKASISGGGNDIVFNYRYVLDGLQQIRGNTVRFQCDDGMSPGVFRPEGDESYVYIIMPIKQ